MHWGSGMQLGDSGVGSHRKGVAGAVGALESEFGLRISRHAQSCFGATQRELRRFWANLGPVGGQSSVILCSQKAKQASLTEAQADHSPWYLFSLFGGLKVVLGAVLGAVWGEGGANLHQKCTQAPDCQRRILG